MEWLTELSAGISCIDTGYQRPGLAACYLLEEAGEAAFIDTGTAHTLPRLLQLLKARGLAPEQVKYVIPTHVHLDHAGGAGGLMQRLPRARLAVHPRGARHLIDPAKLIAGARAVYGEARFRQLFGELLPVDPERVMEAADTTRLSVGGRELLCLDTPGHARHHICIYDQRSRGVFSGDSFGLCYRELDTPQGPFILPTTTPVQFDPEAWHGTLQKLLELRPETFYLTHFGAITASQGLGDQLAQGIDAFATIALDASGNDRLGKIRRGLLAWVRERLRSQGADIGAARLEAVLGMDLDLNAQGLEIWLRRRESP